MKSLKSLTNHLRSLQLISDDAFDSWAESGRLEYSGATLLDGKIPAELLYRLQYEAVLSWEDWHGDGFVLFGTVMEWLETHDYDFDLHGMPQFDAEFLDDELVNIEIKIRFDDAVYRITQPDGSKLITPDAPTPTAIESVSVCGGGNVTPNVTL